MFSNILSGAAGFPVADLGDEISQSVRFRGSQSLTREFASNHGTTNTVSFWFKRGTLSTTQTIFLMDDGANRVLMNLQSDDEIRTYTNPGTVDSTARFRDTSAWYHFVINSGTAWINNQQIYTGSLMANYGGANDIFIGKYGVNNLEFFDGYLADVHMVTGTDLTPSSFGRTNDAGVWVPKNYTGTYGTQGFHLDFADSSDLGNDVSGNNNDFTASGFNTTAISSSNIDNDIDFDDTPTNNYCVLNPNLGRSASLNFEKANLRAQYGAGGAHAANMTFGIPKNSGKWYWEVTLLEQKEGQLGVVSEDYDLENDNILFGQTANGWAYFTGEGVRKNNNTETSTSHTVFAIDDTVGFLLDTTAGTLEIEINGVAQTSGNGSKFTNIPTDKRIYPFYYLGGASGDANLQWNFGQHAFQHEPTGYKHINTDNLPEPTIKKGNKHFGILTYSAPGSPSYPITIDGSGGNNGTGELDFDQSPDLVWIKMRNGSENNIIFDTVRGTANSLRSDENIAENTTRTNFAFATNGFTFSAAQSEVYQQNDSYVAWCWKAGGTAVSNSDGTITSSVSANTDAGFSIVSYTGTATNATVGHGLNSTPDVVVVKNRDTANEWHVKHKDLSSNNNSVRFNSDAMEADFSVWQNTAPTSTVFSIGTQDGVNKSGSDFIAYCWHSVEGYSKFGSYNGFGGGGGNPDYNGPFIYLGFKPALLIIKRFNASGDSWIILDSTRDTHNFAFRALNSDTANAEVSSGDQYAIDFLSNGFKIRSSNAAINNSSGNYIYMAWAENPFGGENMAPATAR